jgi:hypothetical protein
MAFLLSVVPPRLPSVSVTLTVARRQELAAFLRARRAGLTPGQLGLPDGPRRRRVPGLRREEVAQLSGVGLTWYTWLEQARDIPISDQVVSLLARALRLDEPQRRHLRRLAGLAHHEADAGQEVSEVVRDLLEALMPNPAYVTDRRRDIVAWNRAETALWRDLALVPPERRNLVWLVFTDAELRGSLVEWEAHARQLLGTFRAEAGEHAGDPAFAGLVEELRCASPEFRRWWSEYPVLAFRERPNPYRHRTLGLLRLRLLHLAVLDRPGLRLTVHLPADEESAAALRKLVACTEADDTAAVSREPGSESSW